MKHLPFSAPRGVYIVLACTCLAAVSYECRAAETSPYQARVVAAGAAVHSGPGEKYYPTDTLGQGDLVEVYREKPGWLAIRPPLNSFSWVSARDLSLRDGGLAEIARDDVLSRIGSRLNDQHNAAQVHLKKGEIVEVLGEGNIRGEKWYRIAPPAGEFRWIQASLVEKAGPIPAAPSTASSPAVATSSPASPPSPAANDPGVPPLLPGTAAADPAAAAKPGATAPASSASSTLSVTTPPQSSATGTGDLSHELSSIELRLSRMAAAPTNLWNTERLERDTAQLMARAKTPAERDAVRVTQDKINRFAEIGRRHNNSTDAAARNSSLANTSAIPTQPPAPSPQSPSSNYDAVGILRPVVSRRPGAPQFALVDERGQVVSFVTSTPDLNLQPYLGRRIGVVGNRGFIPEFQRSNVTATRVTPLNERLVR
jgi:SH3-like domain-containing protein